MVSAGLYKIFDTTYATIPKHSFHEEFEIVIAKDGTVSGEIV